MSCSLARLGISFFDVEIDLLSQPVMITPSGFGRRFLEYATGQYSIPTLK